MVLAAQNQEKYGDILRETYAMVTNKPILLQIKAFLIESYF